MLAELNRATRDVGKSRNEFITQAVERALNSDPDDYTAGYKAGRRAGWSAGWRGGADRLWRMSMEYGEALQLVSGGMTTEEALRQVFEKSSSGGYDKWKPTDS